MLRVHSKDLHEHVVSEAGECLDSGLYTDVTIRCRNGETVHAHKLVLAAVSPYLRSLMESTDDVVFLDVPECDKDEIDSLISIVYSGSIDASVEEIKKMLTLAHSLYISVPVSEQLNSILGLSLVPHPPPPPPTNINNNNNIHNSLGGMGGVDGVGGLSLLQQQILNQYAFMNGLVGAPGTPLQPPAKKLKSGFPAQPSGHADGQQAGSPEPGNSHLNQIIHSSYNLESGTFTCSICESSYSNKGNYKQHIEKHSKNGDLAKGAEKNPPSLDTSSNLYHCDVCNSSYNHPGNFKQHMLKHDREQRTKVERTPESNHLNSVLQSAFADRVDNGDPSKTYVCEDCNRTFKHPGNFKQHMASHNRPQISAPSFANILKRPMPGLLKMVNGEKNGNQESWDCPECKARFDRDVDLQAHMKDDHDIEMVIPPCSVKEEDEEDLLEDLKVSAQLGDQEAIKALAIAAGEARLANFHCDVPGCYQSFTTEGWLVRHRQKQHSDLTVHDFNPRIYACIQCGKEFNKPSKLTQHLKTHSPESHYKYPCDICGKKFTRPQHVNRHKLLHTGERPYSCPTCDKTFAREDKLKMHVKSGCSGQDLDMSLESGMTSNHDDSRETDDNLPDVPTSTLQVGVMG